MFNITKTMKKVYYDKMITKSGKGSSKAIMYVTDEIQKFMDENEITLKDFLYIMKNELTDFPKCQYCGKEIRKKLYNASRYCSKSCGTYATKQMKEETCLKKYGVKDYSATDEYKNHMLEISQKRTEEEKQSIVDKRKKTMMDRYDAECALKVNKFKEKKNKTTKDRYGVENYSQTEEWKKYASTSWTEEKKKEVAEKIKHTVNQKYGVDYYSQTEEFKENRKKTIQEKYGVNYYSQTEEWQNKIKSTSKDKYGVEYYFQSKDFLSNERKKYYDKFIKLLDEKNFTMISSKEDYINLKEQLLFKCNDCGTEFYSNGNKIFYVYCPHCNTKLYSHKEKEVFNYVKSIYSGAVIENDRTILSGKELDIYIPDKNIAIEFDGKYWHSDLFVDKDYHLNKTLECQDKGIRLIHIFEYDWNLHKKICQSIIASALGIYERKLYARKCIVRCIDNDLYKEFLMSNHIQGSINSSFRLGLFYGKELVAVMGFGKSRFKKDEYELHRFCTKLHTQVVGGFSKLIKHSGINEFISYVDRARFTGEGYVKNGFQIVNYTKPSYVYVRNDVIFNRMSCQKHKLSNILEEYDETQSEYDNMVNNGYFRIYDCGTIKVKYILDK